MLNRDHLSLRTVRLKGSEACALAAGELSFIFPIEGTGITVSPHSNQRLAAGDVLVVTSLSPGKLQLAPGDDLHFRFSSVSPYHLFPLFAPSELCLLPRITERFRNSRFYDACTPVAKACHEVLRKIRDDVDPARLEHRLHVLSAVAAIFCDEFAATRAQAADSVALERRLAPVLDRLALDEFLELTAPQLAVKFNCGRRHLNRLFHHYSGLSISALRVEVRLVKAVSLLRDPTVKVVEVAGQCGFSHLGYFNACFRRRFGVTPGQWRENLVDMKASSSRGIDTSPECRLHANGLCPWSPTMPANSRGSVARESKVTVAVCSATFARLKPNDGSGCRDEPSPGIPSAPAASEKATGIVDPSQPLSPFSGNDHATKGRDGAARSDQSPASYTATESTTTQAACARL